LTLRTLSKPQVGHVTKKNVEHGTTRSDLAGGVSLGEVVQDFLERYRAREQAENVSAETVEKYENVLRQYSAWLEREGHPFDMASVGGKRGADLIRGYLNDYLKAERGMTGTSRATHWRCLRRFWKWAANESCDDEGEAKFWPYVRRAPVDFIKPDETPSDRPSDETMVPYSRDEAARMLAEIGPSN
jgi:hypothetical protein